MEQVMDFLAEREGNRETQKINMQINEGTSNGCHKDGGSGNVRKWFNLNKHAEFRQYVKQKNKESFCWYGECYF